MDKKLNKPLWKKMQRCWDNDMYVVINPQSKGPKPKVKLSIDIKGDYKHEMNYIYKILKNQKIK